MLQKTIRSGLIRGITVLILMGIGTYFSAQSGDDLFFRAMVTNTVIATAIAGFSAIYDYDIWSVKKKIIVHTGAMLLVVFPALVYSGWFDTSTPLGYLWILLSFALFGFVFASIGYLVSKYILKNVPEQH